MLKGTFGMRLAKCWQRMEYTDFTVKSPVGYGDQRRLSGVPPDSGSEISNKLGMRSVSVHFQLQAAYHSFNKHGTSSAHYD